MRQRLVIILTIALVVGILILLNAIGYARPDQIPETESNPNRSTYNAGPTGTRALYDVLDESGYKVSRWREPSARLAGQTGDRVGTFVMIGTMLRGISPEDARNVLSWVRRGGHLVIIDRSPTFHLLPKSGLWRVSTQQPGGVETSIDPASSERMTDGVDEVHPLQPAMLTRDVRSIRPSRFASVINLIRPLNDEVKLVAEAEVKPAGHENQETDASSEGPAERPGGYGPPVTRTVEAKGATKVSPAPVVYANTAKGALLVDYAHGAGRIILLSDPYIVSNGGIRLADNLHLAINAVAGSGGLIAFDEFHQGHTASENPLLAYFADTPILAICGQLLLIVLAVVWTRGRRFGRPLPLPQVDRRSSLEFVASMAELQQRARALDLAVENIYSRTRRVLTRYAGVDYGSPRSHIAERIAARSSLDRAQVEELMRKCEETINGAPITERQTLELVRRLRELEGLLGLRTRSREAKQAAENI